jgi:hypothetical protein
MLSLTVPARTDTPRPYSAPSPSGRRLKGAFIQIMPMCSSLNIAEYLPSTTKEATGSSPEMLDLRGIPVGGGADGPEREPRTAVPPVP